MLSIGMNRKLGKKIAVFNLPARKTCPGRTPYCNTVCYATKAERCYPSAKASRENNYKASKKKDFVDKITTEILKSKVKMMRWHESGDCYNQDYLNKIIEICNRCPDVKFLMYTKMYDRLEWHNKPSNLVLYASLDPTSFSKMDSVNKCIFNISTIVDKEEDAPKGDNWYICKPMKDTKHHNYCGEDCLVCWNGSHNAVWIKH